MGTALEMVAQQLKTPPMSDRALPPVLVLLSDGQPTDDFEKGLRALMAQPWAKKAVRIAIAIGQDADEDVLQKFIAHPEFKPLKARSCEGRFNPGGPGHPGGQGKGQETPGSLSQNCPALTSRAANNGDIRPES